MTSQPHTPLGIIIALLLLPVLYVGSYLALVRPGPPFTGALSGVRPHRIYTGHYRFGREWSERVFRPVELIDRKLRPKAWRTGSAYLISQKFSVTRRARCC